MNSNIEYGNYVMDSFEFESGRVLENVNVEYGVTGIPKYDDEGNITNAVLYCPALKGGHSILARYHDLIYAFNKDEYYFIKVTFLGAPESCSPSTTGLKSDFPYYSIKDRVNFKKQFLAEKLNIHNLLGIVGEGSGGFEVYTWAAEYPDDMEFIISLNSTFKTYGYRYVMVSAVESIIDSCEDFYSEGYSTSLTKIIVAIAKVMFLGRFSKSIFEELSNDELDVLMEDFIDEGLFMDVHDFKSRNDCFLNYDVSDKLPDIKAKSLIIGLDDHLYFNSDMDILPLKDNIENSKVVAFKDKESYYDEDDFSDIGHEINSFLEQFK